MALTRREAHRIAANWAADTFRSRAAGALACHWSREDLEIAYKHAIWHYDYIIASIVIEEES